MSDFWKPTHDMFSPFIERPKMTEKLLQKPPFKYLYDIVMETIKKSNCGNDLYSGPELNAEFFADKDKKINFLTKIIKLVELMSGAAVQAKPQKIVAGLEPQLTNLFLQDLFKCATSGKASKPYVDIILGKAKAQPEPQKKQPEKKQPQKKELKKPERPPSAARLKKPEPQPTAQQPSKKIVKEEQEQLPPPEQKPSKPQPQAQKPAAKQEQNYSGKVRELMKEAEEEVVAQKQTEKQQSKNSKGINLGKLNKKKKDTSEKIISAGTELTDKELELVQSMIQSICQNTAPLGKSIEFINDDVDAMNKELTHWRKQYNASKAKTQSEMKQTEQALNPIYDKIHQIEEQVLDQKSKIQTIKAQILKNDSVIRDLLMSVVTTK